MISFPVIENHRSLSHMPSSMSPDLRSTDQIRFQRQHVTWLADPGLRGQTRNQKPGRESPVIRGKTRQDESHTVWQIGW